MSNEDNETNVLNAARHNYEETSNNGVQDTQDVHLTNIETENVADEKKTKKKITITVDEDDPCLTRGEKKEDIKSDGYIFIGLDPRFQQQNQTLRCWVMYTDFYRCEHILGKGSSTCTWFKHAFTTMCPNYWIRRWDKLRVEGKFPWHKYRTQGKFPGDKYGV